jgi:hypothetical protein
MPKKCFYGVFELPLPRNAQKNVLKQKSRKKSSDGGWVGLRFSKCTGGSVKKYLAAPRILGANSPQQGAAGEDVFFWRLAEGAFELSLLRNAQRRNKRDLRKNSFDFFPNKFVFSNFPHRETHKNVIKRNREKVGFGFLVDFLVKTFRNDSFCKNKL